MAIFVPLGVKFVRGGSSQWTQLTLRKGNSYRSHSIRIVLVLLTVLSWMMMQNLKPRFKISTMEKIVAIIFIEYSHMTYILSYTLFYGALHYLLAT